MDQDLHGKMVADVYLTLFSHHWALVIDRHLHASARGWSGGAEKLAYHLSDRHHWQVQNCLTATSSVS
jgi:hypothetical protein